MYNKWSKSAMDKEIKKAMKRDTKNAALPFSTELGDNRTRSMDRDKEAAEGGEMEMASEEQGEVQNPVAAAEMGSAPMGGSGGEGDGALPAGMT
mmetsp:Transcript_18115/g.32901  ORF Transcript_18115/g.32901 Transcript_18115/m.32901 type:complete len:94 (+) Transcript_18115:287-568(+)